MAQELDAISVHIHRCFTTCGNHLLTIKPTAAKRCKQDTAGLFDLGATDSGERIEAMRRRLRDAERILSFGKGAHDLVARIGL